MLSHPTPAPAKCESKSGHVHGLRNSPTTGTMRPTTPKRASGNERAIKLGVQGAPPPALFLPISREKWGPRRAGGPPGRCAPRHRKSPDHPKGTQYPTTPPPGTGREPTPQVLTCGGPKPGPPADGREGPPRRSGPAAVPTGPPTNDGGPPPEGPRKAPRCLHRAASSPNSAQVEAPVTRTSCQVPMTAGSAARWTSRPPAVRAVRRPSSPWPSTRQRRVLPT